MYVCAVKRLGFPYWPAYLEAKSPATKEEFRYGANFAVASGTALNQRLFKKKHLNVSSITPYSLDIQIGWFKKMLAAIATTNQGNFGCRLSLMPWHHATLSKLRAVLCLCAERKEVMAKSLFLVGEIGANDYNHPFFQNRRLGWVKPLVPRVIRSIAMSIEVRP